MVFYFAVAALIVIALWVQAEAVDTGGRPFWMSWIPGFGWLWGRR